MTKQEKIQEAYGEFWEVAKLQLNDDYSCDFLGSPKDWAFNFKIIFVGISIFRAIPFEIVGIENNNGWINIESESDLPVYGYYEVIERKTGNQSRATLDNDFGVKINLKTYSHYQKIKEIPNPIY